MLLGLLGLAELGLVVYCVLSVLTTPENEARHLPRLAWLLLIVLVPFVGGIGWLVAGRPSGPPRSLPSRRSGASVALSPDDDEAFLRGLRERAEEQRRQAERERREGETDPG